MSSAPKRLQDEDPQRARAAPRLTSKLGFSVVAPIRVMVPSSDVRKKAVLLGLVEAVDLVDEEDGLGAAGLEPLPRLAHDLADPGHSLGDRAEGHEDSRSVCWRPGGPGWSCRCRRPPEDHRARGPPLDGVAQWLARPSRCSWPTNSSRVAGRIRAASGRVSRPLVNRESCRGGPCEASELRGRPTGRCARRPTIHTHHNVPASCRLSIPPPCDGAPQAASSCSVTKKPMAPPKNARAVSQPRLAWNWGTRSEAAT